MRILQINITANWGSHGKIAEGIGLLIMQEGWESHIAYGRWWNPSLSQLHHIGSNFDEAVHLVSSRILDNHGLMSKQATKRLIAYIKELRPDIIHLHNIHGYYLHYPILFRYLAKSRTPVVWTLHDCWPFTGHCAHYMFANCHQWESHCQKCPLKTNYPRSIFLDRSFHNFEKKRQSFLSLDNIVLVPVSKWLEDDLRKSFFANKNIQRIYNGIDTSLFRPSNNGKVIRDKYHLPQDNRIILGVASNWYRKGLDDFIQLHALLDSHYSIVVVGLKEKEMKQLPAGIIGLKRTENRQELIDLYSSANVYFNPTWEDNFPTTNLEALACGTPVVTYHTGGSPESIDYQTGFVVEKGDLKAAIICMESICQRGPKYYQAKCRQRVVDNFNNNQRFNDYIQLYKKLTGQT